MTGSKFVQYYEETIRPRLNTVEDKIFVILRKQNVGFRSHYATSTLCGDQFSYPKTDILHILNLLGYKSLAEFKREIRQFIPNKAFNIMADESNILLVLLMRYFTKHHKREKALEVSNYFHARFFSVLTKKYFPFKCKDSVLNASLSSMSSRFLFKKSDGGVNKLVQFMAEETLRTQENKILTPNDKALFDFLIYTRTKVNGIIKNIASDYYSTEKKKIEITANKSTSITDEDGGEVKITFSNDSSFAMSVTNEVNQVLRTIDKNSLVISKCFQSFKNTISDDYKTTLINEVLLNDTIQNFLSKQMIIELGKSNLLDIKCSNSYIQEIFSVLNKGTSTNEFRKGITAIIDQRTKEKSTSRLLYYKNVTILFMVMSLVKTKCKDK